MKIITNNFKIQVDDVRISPHYHTTRQLIPLHYTETQVQICLHFDQNMLDSESGSCRNQEFNTSYTPKTQQGLWTSRANLCSSFEVGPVRNRTKWTRATSWVWETYLFVTGGWDSCPKWRSAAIAESSSPKQTKGLKKNLKLSTVKIAGVQDLVWQVYLPTSYQTHNRVKLVAMCENMNKDKIRCSYLLPMKLLI